MRIAEQRCVGDFLEYKSLVRHEYVEGAIIEEGIVFYTQGPYSDDAHYHQPDGKNPFYFLKKKKHG